MTNELSEITKISDTEMYTASIHFYSKGASDQVTVAMNVSQHGRESRTSAAECC